MDGLTKYYNDLLGDCQRVNNLTTLNPEIINNPSIFSILASKYYLADEKDIKIDLDVFIDLNQLYLNTYEFTRILGILLDNSIEAAQECNEKVIKVEFRKGYNENKQVLLIQNTYKDKNINTTKIFDKAYSTKKNNSGLGLWEIKQILKKNKHIQLYTHAEDKYFKQELIMSPRDEK